MKFLIIQTAFTGDVVLATSLAEKIHASLPNAEVSMLVRKGNESLLSHHPYLKEVLIWDKKQNKFGNLIKLIGVVKKNKFDVIINLQRFAGTGFLTALSGAKERLGFAKNPFSFFYTKKFPHTIGDGTHEIQRNQLLIEHLTDSKAAMPRLYPDRNEFEKVKSFQAQAYVTFSAGSIWFTKTFPLYKWVELADLYAEREPDTKIFLLGSKAEDELGNEIISKSKNQNIANLAGKLSFLESTALMKDSKMNYVNDSAPMHMAGAINANVTAIYCSTVPNFGFGPLSDNSRIIETKEILNCRPCGLHGYKECPQSHFKCAHGISINDVYQS
jgi:heptosyltransferase-2